MPDVISRDSDEKGMTAENTSRPWFEPMASDMGRIANFAERAREMAPGLLTWRVTVAATAGQIYQSHVRMRVKYLIFSCPTATIFTLRVNTTNYSFNVGAGEVYEIAFPITIDRGNDIQVSVADAIAWHAYLFYYAE